MEEGKRFVLLAAAAFFRRLRARLALAVQIELEVALPLPPAASQVKLARVELLVLASSNLACAPKKALVGLFLSVRS